MKILYVVSKKSETSIPLEVAVALAREEWNITIAAFKVSKNEYPSGLNCPVVELGAQGFFDIYGIWKLCKCIFKYQPDVIHVHHTASSFWGGSFGKIIARSAVVRSEHSNQRHYTFTQSIVHWCSQVFADRILCNSKNTYRNLYPPQKWAAGDDWDVVYNGVDVSRIDAASHQEPPFQVGEFSDQTLVGSVGRLIDAKNYQRLVRSFSSVLDEIPGAQLVLIGDGENRSQLEQETVKQGIEGRVTFTGELPRDDVYAALHQFDLFVIPSLWEGFCNAVVEAMAARNPVVCSDIPTFREVVGEVATYVNPDSSSDIARGMLELLSQEEEVLAKRGQACRERAVEQYPIQRTARKYIKSYYQVVGQKPPNADQYLQA